MTRSPALFGLLVMLAHLALALPMLARHHFDPSVFIVAGDRFVDAARTPAPIVVRRHSDGYDGQFYYRLALTPWLARPVADGVTLDHPAWRMQRIFYPVMARLLAGGQAAWVPASLFAVNLAGLFGLGLAAAWLARRHKMPPMVPLAIAAWPGLLIALTHDTTEILAAVLLLAGIAAWLSECAALGAVALTCAALTRETAVLAAAGILAAQVWRVARPGGVPRPWRQLAWAALPPLAFLAWRQHVTALWQDAPQAHGVAQNAGWPLVGMAQVFAANLINQAVGLAHRPRDLTSRATVLWGIAWLAWFTTAVARGLPTAWRQRAARGPVAGWLVILALMALLTANGPWVEPTAWLRAFTEFWVVGWVLLGLAGWLPARPGWLLPAALPLLARNFELCLIQLR